MRRTAFFPSILVTTFVCVAAVPANGKGVRAQLTHLQEQTGLSLAEFDGDRIRIPAFKHRDVFFPDQKLPSLGPSVQWVVISPDGSEIAFALKETQFGKDKPFLRIVRSNGSDLREYPEIVDPSSVCWSYDSSKIVLFRAKAGVGSREYNLVILDLASKTTQEILPSGSATSQCWSPDGKQLVYEAGTLEDPSVWMYDIAQKKSRKLAVGSRPTWSPDGSRIAFSDGAYFYCVHSNGEGKLLLFHTRGPTTGLVWSPDSRFVAYKDCCYLWPFDPSNDTAKLRVRRLSDGSDDWVYWESRSFHAPQWIYKGKPQ